MENRVLNDLFDYNLKIYQFSKSFKFSLDSILLAEFVKINNRVSSILDLCTGNCAIPLILSTKTNALIDAIEIQKNIFELGIASIKYNKKDKQIFIYNLNALDIDLVLKNKKYDIITCNPPYFKVTDINKINEKKELAIARHEIKITLEDIFKIASNHLNTKGELYLSQRANRLDEIIIYASKYNLNVKNIELIQTKNNGKPYIVLVRCIKDSGFNVKINNPKNICNLKTYQNLFKEDII